MYVCNIELSILQKLRLISEIKQRGIKGYYKKGEDIVYICTSLKKMFVFVEYFLLRLRNIIDYFYPSEK